MSRIWLFGDSFTADCKRWYLKASTGEDLPWSDELYKRRSWGNDLGKLVGCEPINRANAGCSNYMILDTLIRGLVDIQVNDIVFIGTTRDSRYTYFSDKASEYMETMNWGTRYSLQRDADENDDFNIDIPSFKDISSDKLNLLVDFYTDFNAEADSHIVMHNKVIRNRINDIADIIRSKYNAKCFVWDSNLWEFPSKDTGEFDKDIAWGGHTIFETIYTWTNKAVEDGHWSPNGDLLACHFFNYCIKEGIFDITTKELSYWYLSQGKELKKSLEYVTFNPNLVMS